MSIVQSRFNCAEREGVGISVPVYIDNVMYSLFFIEHGRGAKLFVAVSDPTEVVVTSFTNETIARCSTIHAKKTEKVRKKAPKHCLYRALLSQKKLSLILLDFYVNRGRLRYYYCITKLLL